MPLNKSKGNMYPWVTHTHTHLGGECSHKCTYCYIDNPRFGRPNRYMGKLRMIDRELRVNYGQNKTIFIENCNDLFAMDVPDEFIFSILEHCRKYPNNTYVFQTKNPMRYSDFIYDAGSAPVNLLFGTTIETNRSVIEFSEAPHPRERMSAMTALLGRKFVTIEPILDFDVPILSSWMIKIKPEFVNIGADSKNRGLTEPPYAKIVALINILKNNGIEVREKNNLERLKSAVAKAKEILG